MDILSYLLAKGYTNKALEGLTEVKGANCTIKEIDTSDPTKAVITFEWTGSSGTKVTEDLEIPFENAKNIKSITSTHDDVDKVTVVTITHNDDDISEIEIPDGVDGNSISAITSSNTGKGIVVTINFTDLTKAPVIFTIPRASMWFSGTVINTEMLADTDSYQIGDCYLNSRTYDVFRVEEKDSDVKWILKCNIKGLTGGSAYETYCELHPGATKAEFITAITGQAIQMEKVWRKPSITEPSTEINKWFFYQENDPQSAETIHSIVDSGSYVLDAIVAQNCTLESGEKYYWDAWLEDNYMTLEMNANYSLYAGDRLSIVYDLVNDLVPSSIRPANKVRIVITSPDGTMYEFPAFSTISRGTTYEGDKLATVLGVTGDLRAVKTCDILASTSAWKGITNFSDDCVTAAGYKAIWDGVRYVSFLQPVPVDAEALSLFYDQGVAYFTAEDQARGWLIGAKTNSDTGDVDYILLDGYGVSVSYVDHILPGYEDLSEYFPEYDLLGIYMQTIYVGQTKSDAADVTISTGAATTGAFLSLTDWNEKVRPDVYLQTTAQAIIPAINELNGCVKNEGYEEGELYGIESTAVTAGVDDAKDMESAFKQLYQMVHHDFTAPLGCIMPFAHTSIPDGWLPCDGSAVSRTTYRALFAKIGTTYGAGDGSTTFNLPNLVDRFPEGTDTTSFTGAQIAEGLPNITGSWYSGGRMGWDPSNGSGALHATGSTDRVGSSNSTSIKGNIEFNASWSNSIYGKSTHVQPAAIKFVFCIFAGMNSAEKEVNIFQLMDDADKHIGFGTTTVGGEEHYGYYEAGDISGGLKTFVTEEYVTDEVSSYFDYDSDTGILSILIE